MVHLFRLSALTSLTLALVSCDSFNRPLGDSSNPLDSPGRGMVVADDPYGPAFTPGTFLQTISPNTAIFSRFPRENDQPNKVLPDLTDVKVISTKGSYVKIEVVDTGEVGFVPSVMLGEKRSPNEVPVTLGAGEIPVTPGMALDPSDVPFVAPEPEIPGIEPPVVIDPSRPAE
ncbi:MAG: hypothetical protein KJO21_03445 [Verrucomicrobiae bacterium]|nr:hypothetical protein [Verrucomicrobiae bacterium]NNJ42553.1 hypothetical protein [Akkermansiaceae bacterium]